MSCTAGCPTKDCESYAACLKGKGVKVAYCGQGGADATRQKKWDAELNAYADARAQGIQPEGTSLAKIRDAVDKSDLLGRAYNAAKDKVS